MEANFTQSLLLAFSIFSLSSAAWIWIYHGVDRREHITYWTIACLVIAVGGFFGAQLPRLPNFPSYQVSIFCVFLSAILFNYAISSLLGNKNSIAKSLISAVAIVLPAMAGLHIVGAYVDLWHRPAVVAIFMFVTSFYGFILCRKYYQKSGITLAAALSIIFLLTSLAWVIRLCSIIYLNVGFAYEGGSVNAIIFVSLFILAVLRFMVFAGLVMDLIQRQRQDISSSFNQLKLEVANQEVAKSEERLQYVLNITGDGIWDWNIATGEVKHNDRWMSILGEKPKENIFTNNDFKIHIHPDDLAMVLNHLESTLLNDAPYHIQYRMIRADNEVIWVQDRGQVVERSSTGAPLRMIGAISDISGRKRDQDQIRELAFFDQLTKLPNRNYIKDRIYRAIQESIRDKTYSGLIYLDLDNFKYINDRYGHLIGDVLLTEFGKRVQQAVRPKDIVARIGGDEFLVLLEQVDASKSGATKMLEQIIARIEASLVEPLHLGNGIQANIKVSSGIVIFGEEVIKFDDILKFADLAMYSAKRDDGVSHRFFDEHMQADFDRTIGLIEELSEASDQEQFFAVYQPIVDRDGQCLAYEALARWNHPERGLVMPDDFIPFAKEGGQIVKVGNAIFKYILSHHELWEKSTDYSIMVNVSAHQLLHPGFADQLMNLCEMYDVPMDRLNLELTENVFLSDVILAREVMIRLQQHGVQFALDDFGTGYASLKYLADLPFQYLKIDKRFIAGLGEIKANEVIVDAVLDLAKGLNMKVIAEGVETKEQFEILYKKGCGYFQGWYFGRPNESLQEPLKHPL